MTDDRLDRMGAFDAVMWGIESDPMLRSVVVAMCVLDHKPDVTALLDRIERMAVAVPRLRQRVIGNPVSLVPPRWEHDPGFDIGYHVKRYHVPADGTDRPLLRIAEQLAEQDFDRDLPLWEMAVVDGFDADRTAVVIKLHHSITDGIGAMAMAATMFDLVAEPAEQLGPAPGPADGPVLGLAGRLVNGVRYATAGAMRGGQTIADEAVGLAGRVVADPGGSAVAASTFAQSAARLLAPASEPLSTLMHGRSLSTRLAVIQVPFPALRAAARGAGATINDAYLAAVSGGLAGYHEAHRSPCDHVRVNMPVDRRMPGDTAVGNRWVPARFPLPLDSGDPVRRIQRLGPLLAAARTEPAMGLADTVYRLLAVLPQPAAASLTAGMMKGVDVAVTNVPGPPVPLFAAGGRVQLLVPFAPKCGAAVNIALMTYDGAAFVGVNVDPRAVPDPEVLVEHLRAAFDGILAIADPDAHATVGIG